MKKQFDNIRKCYYIRTPDFPMVKKPSSFFNTFYTFFSVKDRETRDDSELVRATTKQRVDITQSILNTLKNGLGRKVNLAGIQEKNLSVVLAFSNLRENRPIPIDFRLVDNKRASIGSLEYFFPHWIYGEYDEWVSNGGVKLNVLSSVIKNESQYNSLQIGLGFSD